MRMFTRVAETLNFGVAARQLGVSSAMVTRGVAALEAHLEVRLLNRTTRHVSLTDAGHAYWQGCKDLLYRLDCLESTVTSDARETTGTLKILAPEAFAASALADLIAAFNLIEPRISFDVELVERIPELITNDFDIWFTFDTQLKDSSLIYRALSPVYDVVVASPIYLAQHGTPRHPSDLESHRTLLAADSTERVWEFQFDGIPYRSSLRPALSAPSTVMVRHAAIAGLGIACLPHALVHRDLESETLKAVLPQFRVVTGQRKLQMLYASNKYMTRSVRRFIDFVTDFIRDGTSKAQHRPDDNGNVG
ncbi:MULTISPECIES: LysR family transcriptional regulator [Burkholderia]|nr:MULTISPECIES: LysR family transcriptional regulator [Burkholderia]EKS9800342.1 LysR family transcriptional regulator [Burkholderia cepacia]MBU9317649.1 LysR family transcriptional regulator [Burkholderia multivorans]HDR9100495.1 LysR family transcriptional regulator [Burkholderia vietnamiensis]EKS9808273.1 LysR family transcriptional regulator [Burkholderia cepacia]EKS9815837.1 LysR family transcriptional regulator [Burkholderia cepacia]